MPIINATHLMCFKAKSKCPSISAPEHSSLTQRSLTQSRRHKQFVLHPRSFEGVTGSHGLNSPIEVFIVKCCRPSQYPLHGVKIWLGFTFTGQYAQTIQIFFSIKRGHNDSVTRQPKVVVEPTGFRPNSILRTKMALRSMS